VLGTNNSVHLPKFSFCRSPQFVSVICNLRTLDQNRVRKRISCLGTPGSFYYIEVSSGSRSRAILYVGNISLSIPLPSTGIRSLTIPRYARYVSAVLIFPTTRGTDVQTYFKIFPQKLHPTSPPPQ
jgi:hypothetical protein